MMWMISLFLIHAVRAQPANEYDIYLKGQEGERMISCSDLLCANFREKDQRVEFRLKPEAYGRARNFAENNRGIKANLVACGKPISFHLDSRLSDKESLVILNISKELGPCVRGAAKSIRSCEQLPDKDQAK